MKTIELEKTFLASRIPEGLNIDNAKEIIDIYIPASEAHPQLRIRKNGNTFEITKKYPVKEGDASEQIEQTITLTELEFKVFEKIEGKRVHKIRYTFDHNGTSGEMDVFQDDLEGLVLIDFEFDSAEEKNTFTIPNFCLADVTQEMFIAGGMLCGKKYEDIKHDLDKYSYEPIFIK